MTLVFCIMRNVVMTNGFYDQRRIMTSDVMTSVVMSNVFMTSDVMTNTVAPGYDYQVKASHNLAQGY